jgi:hypothetical protein
MILNSRTSNDYDFQLDAFQRKALLLKPNPYKEIYEEEMISK